MSGDIKMKSLDDLIAEDKRFSRRRGGNDGTDGGNNFHQSKF